MNRLKKYLQDKNQTMNSFAEESGIPQPTIWRIVKEIVTPSPKIAEQIEQATKGAVKKEELIWPAE